MPYFPSEKEIFLQQIIIFISWLSTDRKLNNNRNHIILWTNKKTETTKKKSLFRMHQGNEERGSKQVITKKR